MFGYIKPYKPEMKVSELDTFKAVYCGLCRQLKTAYGAFSSLTLSYDFTFISIVALALQDDCKGFKRCSCVGNPLKKKVCHNPSQELTFCASCAMLMIYYKNLDNLNDSGFVGKLKSLAAMPFVSRARKKAYKAYPHVDEIIKCAVKLQDDIENDSYNASVDRAADPSASALALICEDLSEDSVQKKILNRFGYLVGRYVYFADAYDDLESDLKNGEYNPFLASEFLKLRGMDSLQGSELLKQIKPYARGVINVTIAELAPAYELLSLKRYKPILDNIIYLGLHNTIDELDKNKASSRKGGKKKISAEKELMHS